jgi:hypothetical protein
MRVAVVLHIGSLGPLVELLSDVQNVQLAGVTFDLYVNLASGKVDEAQATALIKKTFPQALIQTSENRGMDIGGFLKLLPLVMTAAPAYDYVLKLHTKSNQYWRRSLIVPLCGSATQVRHCLNTLQRQPHVGMIGAARHLYREVRLRRPNYYYLQQLTSQLQLPYVDCHFIGGTMFWMRMSLLTEVFAKRDLHALWNQLNTAETFDPYWYLISYRDKGVLTIEAAQQHWEKRGKAAGRFRNCLDAREHGSTRYLPDGMLEHAWERLFGLLVKVRGLQVTGF